MNRLKVVSLGLLFCSINPVASYVLAANEVEGSISMAQYADGGGTTCVVELKTMQIDLGYYKECKRDKLNFFKLNGVPSGTTIEFNSNAQCSPKGNWHYTVRTYIEPTDTIYISIPDKLSTHKPKDIVYKGVLLESYHYNGGYINGQLACMHIKKGDLVPKP
ncbi:hypothetical protein ACMGT0_23250 [Pseudomonas sp. RHF3.3-3]|uniref:hypothetical protein n=1 Tax=Pseudomonas sp. RHF3.3-3 TaxID=3396624 RepID=UPI003A849965